MDCRHHRLSTPHFSLGCCYPSSLGLREFPNSFLQPLTRITAAPSNPITPSISPPLQPFLPLPFSSEGIRQTPLARSPLPSPPQPQPPPLPSRHNCVFLFLLPSPFPIRGIKIPSSQKPHLPLPLCLPTKKVQFRGRWMVADKNIGWLQC